MGGSLQSTKDRFLTPGGSGEIPNIDEPWDPRFDDIAADMLDQSKYGDAPWATWGNPGKLSAFTIDDVKMLADSSATIGMGTTQIFYKLGTKFPLSAFYFFTSGQDTYWKDFGRKKY